MLTNQVPVATTKTGGTDLTTEVGQIVDIAGTWRDCIKTTSGPMTPYSFLKKQSVLMRLVICSQHKEFGNVTVTTGGAVSITRVGLPVITAITWLDCIERLEMVYITSKNRDVAAQSLKWRVRDLVTISMSGARLIEKDGARVLRVTTWPGYIGIRAISCITWKNLNVARWVRTMKARGRKNQI